MYLPDNVYNYYIIPYCWQPIASHVNLHAMNWGIRYWVYEYLGRSFIGKKPGQLSEHPELLDDCNTVWDMLQLVADPYRVKNMLYTSGTKQYLARHPELHAQVLELVEVLETYTKEGKLIPNFERGLQQYAENFYYRWLMTLGATFSFYLLGTADANDLVINSSQFLGVNLNTLEHYLTLALLFISSSGAAFFEWDRHRVRSTYNKILESIRQDQPES